MKILHVVGARPNFMKVAPIFHEMNRYPQLFAQYLVHTGQHYDVNMSEVFFDDLGMPQPDINLEVGSGSHAAQTAEIMLRFEPVVLSQEPDWVVVVGDVNSTLACSLVCSKMGVQVAHIEAGLRSYDRSMPEEINRLLTDRISDLLFTHSPEAEINLQAEGISPEKIHFVGNVMIDTLVRLAPRARGIYPALREKYQLDRFILATLHRPSNVDRVETLQKILLAFETISREASVIFPIHPRTMQMITEYGLTLPSGDVHLVAPLGYLEFLSLQLNASLVVTDSGGVQEETTYLGIPCLTVRPNTERPITITMGTNRLVEDPAILLDAMRAGLNTAALSRQCPPLWDGKTAVRIVDVFKTVMR
jgi:UDP-N-acetylglucosamine 2-epimerase (non-hydrolysing)